MKGRAGPAWRAVFPPVRLKREAEQFEAPQQVALVAEYEQIGGPRRPTADQQHRSSLHVVPQPVAVRKPAVQVQAQDHRDRSMWCRVTREVQATADHEAEATHGAANLQVRRPAGRLRRVRRRHRLNQVRRREAAVEEVETEAAGQAVQRGREGISEGRQRS